jgi:hypothetical protein
MIYHSINVSSSFSSLGSDEVRLGDVQGLGGLDSGRGSFGSRGFDGHGGWTHVHDLHHFEKKYELN